MNENHLRDSVKLKDINFKGRSYDSHIAYSQAEICKLIFSKYFGQKLVAEGLSNYVKCIIALPPKSKTNLGRQNGAMDYYFNEFLPRIFGKGKNLDRSGKLVACATLRPIEIDESLGIHTNSFKFKNSKIESCLPKDTEMRTGEKLFLMSKMWARNYIENI